MRKKIRDLRKFPMTNPRWTHEIRKSFGMISRHGSLSAALKAKTRNETETKRYNAETDPAKRVSGLSSVWLDEPTILVNLNSEGA